MQTQREILSPKVLLVAAWMLVGLVALPVATAAQEVVYQTNQLTEQPKIADAGQARTAITRSYTAALQQAGLEGRVELAFIVNPDGSVDQESIQVLKTPHDSLGKAAEVAVARIKFQPGKKDGQAVRCQVLMPIVYAAGS
jgi:TonB family protein